MSSVIFFVEVLGRFVDLCLYVSHRSVGFSLFYPVRVKVTGVVVIKNCDRKNSSAK